MADVKYVVIVPDLNLGVTIHEAIKLAASEGRNVKFEFNKQIWQILFNDLIACATIIQDNEK